MFKEPIEIMQNQFYTASATLIVSNGANRLRKLDTFLNEKLIKKVKFSELIVKLLFKLIVLISILVTNHNLIFRDLIVIMVQKD